MIVKFLDLNSSARFILKASLTVVKFLELNFSAEVILKASLLSLADLRRL